MKVLMVGSDPRGRGGMSSVASLIVRHADSFVDLRYVSTYTDGPAAKRIRVWLLGWLRTAWLLITDRPDVLHAHVSERSSVLRKGVLVLLARALRVPPVLHTHGGFFMDWLETIPAPARWMVGVVFRSASAVVVLGDYWRERYTSVFGLDNVQVLGNPVEIPERPISRSPSAGVNVLFLGRFGAGKGSPDLLHAVAELPAERNIRLTMAGDGEVEQTRALADSLGLDASIHGFVGPAERDNLLRHNDVLVLPSYAEVLPMAVLEAMGFGLVPVVTPVGALPEIITDRGNGLLVAPGDISAISAALNELAEDPELRGKLSAAAREAVTPFEVHNYLQRLVDLWNSLRDCTK